MATQNYVFFFLIFPLLRNFLCAKKKSVWVLFSDGNLDGRRSGYEGSDLGGKERGRPSDERGGYKFILSPQGPPPVRNGCLSLHHHHKHENGKILLAAEVNWFKRLFTFEIEEKSSIFF